MKNSFEVHTLPPFHCPVMDDQKGQAIATQVIDLATSEIKHQIACAYAYSKEDVLAKLEIELKRTTGRRETSNALLIEETIKRIKTSPQDAFCVTDMFGLYPDTFNPSECHYGAGLAFRKPPIA